MCVCVWVGGGNGVGMGYESIGDQVIEHVLRWMRRIYKYKMESKGSSNVGWEWDREWSL